MLVLRINFPIRVILASFLDADFSVLLLTVMDLSLIHENGFLNRPGLF